MKSNFVQMIKKGISDLFDTAFDVAVKFDEHIHNYVLLGDVRENLLDLTTNSKLWG
jgi:hypothetical protein